MENENGVEQKDSQKRRDFLKTAGRVAVYTPPTLMLLMNPSVATFAKSAGAKANNGKGGSKCSNGLGNGSDCQVNNQINNDVSATPGNPARGRGNNK